jgi:hypothetical protein
LGLASGLGEESEDGSEFEEDGALCVQKDGPRPRAPFNLKGYTCRRNPDCPIPDVPGGFTKDF